MPKRVAVSPRVDAAVAAGPWIVGPRYDQLFLAAAWCVPFFLWAIAYTLPYGLLVAFVLFMLLDNSHQVATLPLTVFDRGSRELFGRTYFVGAAVIAATAAALAFYPETLAARIWASLVLYWGAFHIIRQHYGFLRLYQARDRPHHPRLAQAEALALYSGSTFPYLMNLSHGWAAHGPVGASLFRLPVPVWSAWLTLGVFVAALLYVLVMTAMRPNRDAPTLRLLHILLVVSNFWIGLMWAGRDDVLLAVLFITAYHDLQYHGIVWLVGRARSSNAEAPVLPVVRSMFGSVAVFAAAIVAGALVQAFLRNDFQVAASVLPQSPLNAALFGVFSSYSYMHYFIDGRMWKMRLDPRLRVELGLASR